jgi:hypothetical protein
VKSNRITAARDVAKDVAERAGEQVHSVELRERLAPVVEHAISVARDQAAQAAVAAGHAKEWATPRAQAAVERSLQAAAPKVEAAAERMVPAVDAARDRIVDDLLPRLVEAVQSAGAAGAAAGLAARAAATETVSRTVEDAARSLADATPTAKARRSRTRFRFFLFGTLAAAFAAGVAAWMRSRSGPTGWEAAPSSFPADRASSTGGAPARPVNPAPLVTSTPPAAPVSASPAPAPSGPVAASEAPTPATGLTGVTEATAQDQAAGQSSESSSSGNSSAAPVPPVTEPDVAAATGGADPDAVAEPASENEATGAGRRRP